MSKPEIPNPEILIEGLPYRSSTFKIETLSDDLPTIDDDDGIPLADLLREHKTEGINDVAFWSLRLLHHILSRDRVLNELRKYTNLDAEKYIGYIQSEDLNPEKKTRTYLKIFALLVLLAKGQEIVNFVKEEVSDQSLPLCRRPGTSKGSVDLGPHDDPKKALECLRKWNPHDRETFEKSQWELLIPYFDLKEGSKTRHFTFEDRIILPWCKRTKDLSATQPSKNEGGFASVSCVKIDPLSHGFHDLLKAISLNDGLFAVKVLHEKDFNNETRFQNESLQLQRFNGLVHDHLVTLLTTFTFRRQYHFLFPYAEHALDQYWESREPKPHINIGTVRWVAKQCSGIMAAMDTIHDPRHLHRHLEVKGYGRHGDIKPDNILWFSSTTGPRGILVVSDLGLSSFHRDTSRSNIPNAGIPKVPGYRPPECDIKGGTISRAYDIWTLGCLFLEFLTWLLGGWDLINEFDQKRRTLYITGAINNIFFDLKKMKGSSGYVAQVKSQVTEWFDKLHNDNNCSQFVDEAFDVIEREMLVVISEDKKRSSSGALREKFDDFCLKCMDTNDLDYCTKGIPIRRMFKSATAVEAILNETAEKMIKENQSDLELETYEGKTRRSMLPENLEKIDYV